MRQAWRQGCRWEVAPPMSEAEQFARRIGCTPLMAQILHNRGIGDPQAAKAFLDPRLNDLHDPRELPGAEQAAGVIARAVSEGRRIVLYGDYDVDGITGLAILHACLHMVGADVHYYVPHRLEEGYGVNLQAVRAIIADGAGLIVTVDCGICAAQPLSEATPAGVDVIVTDHHSPPELLPDVAAIVHPAIPRGAYPNPDLSGAGVAFKLAWQVARQICGETRVDEPMRRFLLDATCLAALGTIADVVPLVGENRVLAVHGLRGLPSTKHPGLRALLDSAGLSDGKLDGYHVGFVLAPRINACGRMGHARLAVELLTDAPAERCLRIAQHLDQQNAQRQKIERQTVLHAVEMVQAGRLDAPDRRAIVLAGESWHGGVIGIVAARLVERFRRPAILIAVNEEGLGQGSGRSIPGFHMRDALAACSEHLIGFGGHAMAGGLKIRRENIDAFAAAMIDYAGRTVAERQLCPSLRVDAEVAVAALGAGLAGQLSRLGPFGHGNPPPVVAVRNCQVLGPVRRMGRNGQTVGMVLGDGAASVRAVGFGMGDLADRLVGVNRVDVAGEPLVNTFNGATSVELKLADVAWD